MEVRKQVSIIQVDLFYVGTKLSGRRVHISSALHCIVLLYCKPSCYHESDSHDLQRSHLCYFMFSWRQSRCELEFIEPKTFCYWLCLERASIKIMMRICDKDQPGDIDCPLETRFNGFKANYTFTRAIQGPILPITSLSTHPYGIPLIAPSSSPQRT